MSHAQAPTPAAESEPTEREPAEPAEPVAISTEELRAHPERFFVAELADEHYVVFDKHLPSMKALELRLVTGRLNALHPVSYRGSSSEGGAAGLVKWSITQHERHVGPYVYADLSFKSAEQPTDEPSPLEPAAQASLTLSCPRSDHYRDLGQKKTLELLSDEQAKTLLTSARTHSAPWRPFSPHKLFRDDWGRYYYIEKNKRLLSQEPYRLWMGYRGALKKIDTLTVADDSEGVVLASKEAAIRVITHSQDHTVGGYWVTDEARRPLLKIPIDRNIHVINSQLGLYDELYFGSLCDALQNRPMPRLDHPETLPSRELIVYDAPPPQEDER